MTKASDNVYPRFLISEGGSTSTPAAGRVTVYAKADGLLYQKDDAGVETLLASGSSASVATDPIWDAAGDTVVGTGANTAARLAIGAAGGALSRVNGAVAWNSGTSFPTAATGDRYWRTDHALECYYDGTRWLSTTLFTATMTTHDVATIQPLSSSPATISRVSLHHTDFQAWLVNLYGETYVNTTNNGTNFWTFALAGAVTGTAYGNFTTAAQAADTHTGHKTALNVAAGGTERGLTLTGTKTLSPGAAYWGATLTYRLIVT